MSALLPDLSTDDLDAAAGGQATHPRTPVARQNGSDAWIDRLDRSVRPQSQVDNKMWRSTPDAPDALEKEANRPQRPSQSIKGR